MTNVLFQAGSLLKLEKILAFSSVRTSPIVHTVSSWSYNGRSLDGGQPTKRSRRHRQRLKEWHRLHGDVKKHVSAWQGEDLERMCPTIRKHLFFKPTEVQSRAKFLKMGLSVGWAIDREARKLSGATGAKQQSWAERECPSNAGLDSYS